MEERIQGVSHHDALFTLCRSPRQPVAVRLPAVRPDPVPEVAVVLRGPRRPPAEVRRARGPLGGPVPPGSAAALPGAPGAHSRGPRPQLAGEQRPAALRDGGGPRTGADLVAGRRQEDERHGWVLMPGHASVGAVQRIHIEF